MRPSGKATIIVSELATNLVRYGQQGERLLRTVTVGERRLIEVLSIDRGPGIANVTRCFGDGYSTRAVRGRAWERCGVWRVNAISTRPCRTGCTRRHRVVRAVDRRYGREWTGQRFEWGTRLQVGRRSRPAPYELLCGDSWRAQRDGQLTLMLVDGLGHGPEAAARPKRQGSRSTAIRSSARPTISSGQMPDAGHARRSARRRPIDPAQSCTRLRRSRQYRRLVVLFDGRTVAGTLFASWHGRRADAYRPPISYDCPQAGVLVMHSDGMQTRWDLAKYPGLQSDIRR